MKASQNKNEESGEGWRFPKEILPDLDSSFLWSIMSAGFSCTSAFVVFASDYSVNKLGKPRNGAAGRTYT